MSKKTAVQKTPVLADIAMFSLGIQLQELEPQIDAARQRATEAKKQAEDALCKADELSIFSDSISVVLGNLSFEDRCQTIALELYMTSESNRTRSTLIERYGVNVVDYFQRHGFLRPRLVDGMENILPGPTTLYDIDEDADSWTVE